MPSMANITVKNTAAVDTVYVAAMPSAGDRSPARWTQNTASPIIGFRPVFEMVTRSNGSGNGRICEFNFVFPVVATVNGVTSIVAKIPFKGAFTAPTNVDAANAKEAFTQYGNLMVSQLVRDAIEAGYAPT